MILFCVKQKHCALKSVVLGVVLSVVLSIAPHTEPMCLPWGWLCRSGWQQGAALVTFHFPGGADGSSGRGGRWVINHLPSCSSCTSRPCSCAASVTSRINGYWWTCLATSSQLAAIPGDAQPPQAWAKTPTQCRAVLSCKRGVRMGLGQICAKSEPCWCSKPRLL